MNQYQVNDLCIIFIFADWWHKLHHYYNNSFKTENVHYIFVKLWSKTWIALLTTIISFIKRKNILWWKISHWLAVWSAMSIISLKSLFSSDEILMKFDHSSFINEFKHSLTSTKSFSSLSIINLTLSSSSFHSSKSRASLHWLVTLWVQKLSFLWLLFQQYLHLSLFHFSMNQWI